MGMKTGRFLVLSIAFCEAEDAVPRLVSASPFCSLLLSLSLYKLMVELIDKFVFNNSHQLLHSPSQICMWFVCLCVSAGPDRSRQMEMEIGGLRHANTRQLGVNPILWIGVASRHM